MVVGRPQGDVDSLAASPFRSQAAWMQTTGTPLLAIELRRLARVLTTAQDGRCVPGLLYLAAVRDDLRWQEHRQGCVDVGLDSFVGPTAHNSLDGTHLRAVLHAQLIIFQSIARAVMAATTAIPTLRVMYVQIGDAACDDQQEQVLRGKELVPGSAGFIIFRWACG